MELSVSGVGPPSASATWRPSNTHIEEAPAPKPDVATAAPPVLAGWFDRNGDGRVDDRDWLHGGDAFLSVGRSVAAILTRNAPMDAPAAPHPAAPHAAPAHATRAAATYEHYGAKSA
jgi:hypothetical protein